MRDSKVLELRGLVCTFWSYSKSFQLIKGEKQKQDKECSEKKKIKLSTSTTFFNNENGVQGQDNSLPIPRRLV